MVSTSLVSFFTRRYTKFKGISNEIVKTFGIDAGDKVDGPEPLLTNIPPGLADRDTVIRAVDPVSWVTLFSNGFETREASAVSCGVKLSKVGLASIVVEFYSSVFPNWWGIDSANSSIIASSIWRRPAVSTMTQVAARAFALARP